MLFIQAKSLFINPFSYHRKRLTYHRDVTGKWMKLLLTECTSALHSRNRNYQMYP